MLFESISLHCVSYLSSYVVLFYVTDEAFNKNIAFGVSHRFIFGNLWRLCFCRKIHSKGCLMPNILSSYCLYEWLHMLHMQCCWGSEAFDQSTLRCNSYFHLWFLWRFRDTLQQWEVMRHSRSVSQPSVYLHSKGPHSEPLHTTKATYCWVTLQINLNKRPFNDFHDNKG